MTAKLVHLFRTKYPIPHYMAPVVHVVDREARPERLTAGDLIIVQDGAVLDPAP